MLPASFTYATVCSGVEAFGPAWHALGMEPVFHAEFDPGIPIQHAANVLRYHYPHVPNHGDFTTIKSSAADHLDLLAGGTPCKHDSVAGLREGDAGIDGHLARAFVGLAAKLGATWVLWENVAGVLSTDGGRRFGAFLGALEECGYGWAYRVFDAQYFGVAQKRRRVFVVGYLGDNRPAGAVLFEPAGLRRDSGPRRKKREEVAGTLTGGAKRRGGHRTSADDAANGLLVTENRFFWGGASTEISHSPALLGHNGRRDDYDTEALVMQCHGSDVGEFGSLTAGSGSVSGGIPFLRTEPLRYGGSHQDVMFFPDGIMNNLVSGTHGNGGSYTKTFAHGRVRRLTERECERLMGWPDDWTRYGRTAEGRTYEIPAGARYGMCGNGWVAPNASWIAERILNINSLITSK